ncbi:ribosome hibernation-promoting factor, HPF/YfiA family [Bacteriovorax sp. DB6_IX]|uniref:ribosome hibernation-promoting factor, HPF/YfiA family n=1 Tax=Bacteriovorax sp. DB6_IX TaxID=1353530 RepID=UPI000389E9D5|nr:ribosome-associated translation inhibitor RaiA [Bacteriovorax sp. DB6_IX]EQC52583.1 ribosomal subunit interface protein [Bacteriovorax sp. DB6_IX]
MKLQITFKNFEHTPALNEQISKKSEKLKKVFPNANLNVNWYCWTEKDTHYSELQVSGHQGPIIMAKAKADNLYKTFDLAIKKVTTQAVKKNEKKHEMRHPRRPHEHESLIA